MLGKHYGERAEVDNAVVVHECRDGIGIVDTTAMQIGMDRRIEVHGTQGTLLHEPIGSNKLRVFLAQETEGTKPASGRTWSLIQDQPRRACCGS